MCIGLRSFTWWMVMWYLISFLFFFPVTVYFNNVAPSQMNATTFSDIMRGAPFWLSLTFVCGLILLPYYAVHCIWYRFLYPEFLPADKKDI
jgi:hypothetical protein